MPDHPETEELSKSMFASALARMVYPQGMWGFHFCFESSYFTSELPLSVCLSLSLLEAFSQLFPRETPFLIGCSWDFPGGPVVKTSHFQCRGCGFDPWSGN